ncbi:hypothetical protein B0H14DRAFT_2560688 [Mycena olivaceomarginata]|nr:hypothetical protein B0H14DRAFT_2560688 [Mycena olivaceomarginata]
MSPRLSTPIDSDDDMLNAMTQETPTAIRTTDASKRSHAAMAGEDDASSDTEHGAGTTLRPLPLNPAVPNQNVVTAARHYAERKRLHGDQLTELDAFMKEPASLQEAKLLANIFAFGNQLEQIIAAKPGFELSDDLETNIQQYVPAILLSDKLNTYKGEGPTNSLLEVIKRLRFGIPDGLENIPADWGKIRASLKPQEDKITKTTTFAEDSEHHNIFELATAMVKGTKCTVNIILCSRIALMSVWIEYIWDVKCGFERKLCYNDLYTFAPPEQMLRWWSRPYAAVEPLSILCCARFQRSAATLPSGEGDVSIPASARTPDLLLCQRLPHPSTCAAPAAHAPGSHHCIPTNYPKRGTHRVGWETTAQRVEEYMLRTGNKRKTSIKWFGVKMAVFQGLRSPADLIMPEEVQEDGGRGSHGWIKILEKKAVDAHNGLKEDWWQAVGETTGKDLWAGGRRGRSQEIKFGSGNLRPALTSNSEEAELLKTIIQTRGGPNYHAHTKKALKTNIFGRYWTFEGIYEVQEPRQLRKCQNSYGLKKKKKIYSRTWDGIEFALRCWQLHCDFYATSFMASISSNYISFLNVSTSYISFMLLDNKYIARQALGESVCEAPVGAVVPKSRNARSSSNFTDMTVPSRFPKLVDARRVKVLPRHLSLWTGAAGNGRTGGDHQTRAGQVSRARAGERRRELSTGQPATSAHGAGIKRAGGGRWARRGSHQARMQWVSWAWAQARAAGNEREGDAYAGIKHRACRRRVRSAREAAIERVWNGRRLSTERVGAKTAGNEREGGGQQARMGGEQAEERWQRGHMDNERERGQRARMGRASSGVAASSDRADNESVAQEGGVGLRRSNRAFRHVLEQDQAKHGKKTYKDSDIQEKVDKFQQKIDDIIDADAMDAATSAQGQQGDAPSLDW